MEDTLCAKTSDQLTDDAVRIRVVSSPRPSKPCVEPLVPNLSTPQRALNNADIVKALEIVHERLGSVEISCETLRSWAALGHITPAGQVITHEAVDTGIQQWHLKRSGVENESCETHGNGTTTGSTALTEYRNKANGIKVGPSIEKKRPLNVSNARAVEDDNNVKQRRLGYEEAKKQRQRTQAHAKEMASTRLNEVLHEVDCHMEEILKRSAPDAVATWRSSPAGVDKRDLYVRLVHSIQVPDIQIPTGLCAELLDHQVEGLEWLASVYANSLHGILADEMGLGKTIQTITFLLYLEEQQNNRGPHLIVAPKSTLGNWQKEFERFAPSYDVHMLTGECGDRQASFLACQKASVEGKAAVLLTNYEQVHRNEGLLQSAWQIIVVDEGHRLKNTETVLHGAMSQLKGRMRLLLTGTPVQNSLNELWALMHYLLPDMFTCIMDFKAWFASPFKGVHGLNEFDVQLDQEQEQKVISKMHSLLAPFMLQRRKSEVLADRLPAKVDVTVRVPLSEWQKSVYADLKRKTIRLLQDDSSVASDQVNNALMQLRKIVLHPYLFLDHYPLDEGLYRTSGKVEMLDRLLTKLLSNNHKVLIFSQFTSMLDILEAYLKWRNIVHVRLDGQVPHEQRRQRIDRFNEDPSCVVFLLSARAGGLGLNLQAADTVILFDLDWNPQNDKQAVARVHRVGQRREVRVLRILTESGVERHIEQRCAEKLDMENKIMGAGMFHRKPSGDQRREALRAMLGLPPSSSSCEAASSNVDSCVVVDESSKTASCDETSKIAEVNRLLARGDHEMASFTHLDAELLCWEASQSQEPDLVRCGRLMSAEEVPKGF